jgi:hypothetical protein
MARNRKDRTYDHALLLHDSASSISSSAAGLVGGAAAILDLGQGRVDATVVVDVTALDVGAGDEATVFAQVSDGGPDDTAFEAGNWIAAGALILGDVTLNGSKADSVVGRYELSFSNEINGTIYRYLRLYLLVAASGALTYTAFAVLPPR